MARKNPLGKLVDTAVDALKHPRGTAEKVVDQARGTASLGKLAAEQVGRAAATTARGTVGAVAERAGLARARNAPRGSAPASTPTSPADLRPVPPVNEPAHPPVEERAAAVGSTTARKAPAKQADGGAPTATTAPAAKKAPAKKAAPARRPAAKRAPAAEPPPAARIQEAAPAVEEVPERRAAEPASTGQEQALATSPDQGAKKAASKGAAAKKAAKKAPAKKAAKKAPVKKTPAAKAVADKAAEEQAPPPGAEAETVWSTSTPSDKLPVGRRKANEAETEVPVTREDREAAHEATPADVAKVAEPGPGTTGS